MISCPRDGIELEIHHKAAGKFEVDVCPRCSGVWLDSAELAELCPTASHLPERRDEFALTPELDGVEPLVCPRCTAPERGARVLAKPVQVAGLLLDFCLVCGGVWLDAEDATEILREPGAPPAPRSATPFRQSAIELEETGETRCGRCNTAVSRARLYAVEGGFVCGECHFGAPEKHREALRSQKSNGVNLVTSLARELLGIFDDLRGGPTARMRAEYENSGSRSLAQQGDSSPSLRSANESGGSTPSDKKS
ncbi:MAG: zf-TFIIB domain-containing protein [Polyangiaceae bacterium]